MLSFSGFKLERNTVWMFPEELKSLSDATLVAGMQTIFCGSFANLGNSSSLSFHHCSGSLSTEIVGKAVYAETSWNAGVDFTMSADCLFSCFFIVIILRIPAKPFGASGIETLVPSFSHSPLAEDSCERVEVLPRVAQYTGTTVVSRY